MESRVPAVLEVLRGRPTAEVAAQYQKIGYDRPIVARYLNWAGGFVTGDWKTTVTPGNGTVEVRTVWEPDAS